jgi:hypothetical protein
MGATRRRSLQDGRSEPSRACVLNGDTPNKEVVMTRFKTGLWLGLLLGFAPAVQAQVHETIDRAITATFDDETTETVCEPEDLECWIGGASDLDEDARQLAALLADLTCPCREPGEPDETPEERLATAEACSADDPTDKAIQELAEDILKKLKENVRQGIKAAGAKLKALEPRVAKSKQKEKLQDMLFKATLDVLVAGATRGDAVEDITDGLADLKNAKTKEQCAAALKKITEGINAGTKALKALKDANDAIKAIEEELKKEGL